MTHQNTTTFSNIGDLLKEKMQEVDEVCPTHGCNLIVAFGKAPICMECGKEEKARKEKEMAEEASLAYYKRNTYSWLSKHSIFLDDTLRDASFDNYKTEDAETRRNKEMALNFAREYYKGATYNTIFTGKAGTGKSHLSMSMLKVVNEYSKPYRKCLFVSVDEMMRRIKDSFNNKDSYYTEQRMIDLLTSADLLVMDDLGAETGAITSDKTATDFTTRTLYAIINGRMNKPTIITTNLSSRDMAKMYDSKLISRMFRGTDGHVISFKETNDKRRMVEF
ncbi:ATP-binding protein [Bacillus licheniformis]|uniref:ATP-binding protein n=1 Tax=Bacillus licheniformis TaxID=1402 RepID=UPI000B8AE11B|nr:ATP-binding protein [Bacillus licheniformis]MED0689935.1 ATP-binding protein [Bacillus licheniformis]MED0713607.1 ATP-binding protein [Bacillus licheniformis]MED0789276.1 ATP-binding protein [Bacillus licheniformis]WIW99358.1 ATP-binding protein [Bacillus licheniformis]